MSSTPSSRARSRGGVACAIKEMTIGHRAQITQLKGCVVGSSVYAGDDANNCSIFQVSVLWLVTLEMCEFEPGQGRGGAARSRKPWRRVQKAVGPAARRCMTRCTTHVSPGLSSIPSESSSRQEDGRGWHLHLSFCEHNTRLPHTHERRLRSLAGAKVEGFHSRCPSLIVAAPVADRRLCCAWGVWGQGGGGGWRGRLGGGGDNEAEARGARAAAAARARDMHLGALKSFTWRPPART